MRAMTYMTRRDLIELGVLLGRETYATPHDIVQLLRMAKRWNTIATNECNRDLTAKEYKTKNNLCEGFKKLAERIGATDVVLSGDPRGCTVKLQVKSGRTTDFGGEGICIL